VSRLSRSAPAPSSNVPLSGSTYEQVKDPCPVHDGRRWHLFGTGIPEPGRFEVLHATSHELRGPWTLTTPPRIPPLPGGCVAAPGVIAEGDQLHMFLQSDFNVLDGRVEHLVSDDAARSFRRVDTALLSVPNTDEAGIYDPHPAVIDGEAFLTYSAFSAIGSPDIHLARSLSGQWLGPWERLGPILRHEHVPFHNARGSLDYEWGLEGAQLLQLPDGAVLLTAVCFLPVGAAGSRQRVFLAVGDGPTGPFEPSGPLSMPAGSSGEHGHACAVLENDDLFVFMQERSGAACPWGYALEPVPLSHLPRPACADVSA
jgi:hypothetical protein